MNPIPLNWYAVEGQWWTLYCGNCVAQMPQGSLGFQRLTRKGILYRHHNWKADMKHCDNKLCKRPLRPFG